MIDKKVGFLINYFNLFVNLIIQHKLIINLFYLHLSALMIIFNNIYRSLANQFP